jgi:RHS repeat-associated protein
LDDAGATTTTLNYDPWGVPEGSVQPGILGFAGELHDAGIGLVNLRARWYRPSQGQFLSRDPWSGATTQPGSLHKYAYAENDPINAVDPTGLRRYKIWAAAFISPANITFPYSYGFECNLRNCGPLIDWNATFDGDGRSFTDGMRYDSSNPRSRQWNEVTIDTDPTHPVVVPGSNLSDTGITRVVWHDQEGNRHVKVGKALAPGKATVNRIGCNIRVNIYTSRGNPLVTPSPPIEYSYYVNFVPSSGVVTIAGEHSLYPWHELHISEVGRIERFDPTIEISPSANPLLLFSPIPWKIPYHERRIPVEPGCRSGSGYEEGYGEAPTTADGSGNAPASGGGPSGGGETSSGGQNVTFTDVAVAMTLGAQRAAQGDYGAILDALPKAISYFGLP